jgi:hypothetical protein
MSLCTLADGHGGTVGVTVRPTPAGSVCLDRDADGDRDAGEPGLDRVTRPARRGRPDASDRDDSPEPRAYAIVLEDVPLREGPDRGPPFFQTRRGFPLVHDRATARQVGRLEAGVGPPSP